MHVPRGFGRLLLITDWSASLKTRGIYLTLRCARSGDGDHPSAQLKSKSLEDTACFPLARNVVGAYWGRRERNSDGRRGRSRGVPDAHRYAIPFCQGLRLLVRLDSRPVASRNCRMLLSNLASPI